MSQINFKDTVIDLTDETKAKMMSAHEKWAEDNLNPKERALYLDRARKTLDSMSKGMNVDLRGKNAYGDRHGNVGSEGAAQWADNNTYSMLMQLVDKAGATNTAATTPKTTSTAAETGAASSPTNAAGPVSVNYIREYLDNEYGFDGANNLLTNNNLSEADKYELLKKAVKYGLGKAGRNSEIEGVDNLDLYKLIELAQGLANGSNIVKTLMGIDIATQNTGIRPDYTVVDDKNYGNYILVRNKEGEYILLDKTKNNGKFLQEVELPGADQSIYMPEDGEYGIYTDAAGNLKFGKIDKMNESDYVVNNYRLKSLQFTDANGNPIQYVNYNRNKQLNSTSPILDAVAAVAGVTDLSYSDFSDQITGNPDGDLVFLLSGSTGKNGSFYNTKVVVYNDKDGAKVLTLTTNPDRTITATNAEGKTFQYGKQLRKNITKGIKERVDESYIDESGLDPNFLSTTVLGAEYGPNSENRGLDNGFVSGVFRTAGRIMSPMTSALGFLSHLALQKTNKNGDVSDTMDRYWDNQKYVADSVVDVIEKNKGMAQDIMSDAALQKVASVPKAIKDQYNFAYRYLISRGHIEDMDDEDAKFCAIYTYMLLVTAGYDKVMQATGLDRTAINTFAQQLKTAIASMGSNNAAANEIAIANEAKQAVSEKEGGRIPKALQGMQIGDRQRVTNADYEQSAREQQLYNLVTARANTSMQKHEYDHNARLGKGASNENSSWNAHDYASLVAGGLDLGSFAGGFVGVGFALAAAAVDAVNDFTNEEVDTATALKRLGMNLGLSALCFVPGLAGAKAATKLGKGIVKGSQKVMSVADNLAGAKKILTSADDIVRQAVKAGATPKEAAELARKAIVEGKRVTGAVKGTDDVIRLVEENATGLEKFGQVTAKFLGKGAQYGMLTAGTAAGVSGAINIVGDIADGKGADVDDLRSLVGLAGGVKAAKSMLLNRAMKGVTKNVSELDGFGRVTANGEKTVSGLRLETKGNKTAIANITDETGKKIFTNNLEIEGGIRMKSADEAENAALALLKDKRAKMQVKADEIRAKGSAATADEAKQLKKLDDDIKLLDDNFIGSAGKVEFSSASKIKTDFSEKVDGVKGVFHREPQDVRVLKTLDEIAGKTGATMNDLSGFQRWGYRNAQKAGIQGADLARAKDVMDEQINLINHVEAAKAKAQSYETELEALVKGNAGLESKLGAKTAGDAKNIMEEIKSQKVNNIKTARSNEVSIKRQKAKEVTAKADLDKAQAKFDKVNSNITAKQTELDAKKAKLDKLNKLKRAAKTKSAATITKVKAEIKTLEGELTSLQTDFGIALGELNTAKTLHSDIANEISRLTKENKNLIKKNKDLQELMSKVNKNKKGSSKNEFIRNQYDLWFGNAYDKTSPTFKLADVGSDYNRKVAQNILSMQYKQGGSLDSIAVRMYTGGGTPKRNMTQLKQDDAFWVGFNPTVAQRVADIAKGTVNGVTVEHVLELITGFQNILNSEEYKKYAAGNHKYTYVGDIIKDYQDKFHKYGFNSDFLWNSFKGHGGSTDKKPGKGETYKPDQLMGRQTDHRRVGYFNTEELDLANELLEGTKYSWTPIADALNDGTGRLYYTLTENDFDKEIVPKEKIVESVVPGQAGAVSKPGEVNIEGDKATASQDTPEEKKEGDADKDGTGDKSGNKGSAATVTTGDDFNLSQVRENNYPGYNYNDYWIREGMPKLNLAHTNNEIVSGIENDLEDKLASRKLPYRQEYRKTTSNFDERESLMRQKADMLSQYANVANLTSDINKQLAMLNEGLSKSKDYDESANAVMKDAFDKSYAAQEQARINTRDYNNKVYQQNVQIQNAADQARVATAEQKQTAGYESALAAMDGYNTSVEKEKFKQSERNSRLYQANVATEFQKDMLDIENWYNKEIKGLTAEEEAEKAYAAHCAEKESMGDVPLTKEAFYASKGYTKKIREEQEKIKELNEQKALKVRQANIKFQQKQLTDPNYYSDMYNIHMPGALASSPLLEVNGKVSAAALTLKSGGTISAYDRSLIEHMKQAFQTLRKHADILEKEAARNQKKAEHILDGLAARFNEASKVFLK